MNYFELFEIPVHLKVDADELSEKFFMLSRRYHPDYFINAPYEKQAEALEISAQLNKAFKTFKNEDELKGLLEDEEKYQLPQDFLMEVLEINEQLMDAEDDPELRKNLQDTIDNLQLQIYEPVKKNIENYQEGVTSEEELLQVKEYYYKKKYLDRLKRELSIV
mgnify:CR=1 FL=1